MLFVFFGLGNSPEDAKLAARMGSEHHGEPTDTDFHEGTEVIIFADARWNATYRFFQSIFAGTCRNWGWRHSILTHAEKAKEVVCHQADNQRSAVTNAGEQLGKSCGSCCYLCSGYSAAGRIKSPLIGFSRYLSIVVSLGVTWCHVCIQAIGVYCSSM